MEEKRIEPLSNIVPIWDEGCGPIPSRVKVALKNGKIGTFWRRDAIPKWKPWRPIREIIGYPRQEEYQPKHLKRPADAANIRPAPEQNFR